VGIAGILLRRQWREPRSPAGCTADRAAATSVNATAPLVLRTFEQVSAFFDGFDLVEPGLCKLRYGVRGKPPRPKDLVLIAH
jgi:hypothetical protein